MCKKCAFIFVRATPQAVFHYLSAQGTILNDYEVKSADPQKLKVFLKGKANLLSWGEDITIEARSEVEMVTRVTITSDPIWSLAEEDGGRNEENMSRIAYFIYGAFPYAQMQFVGAPAQGKN